jgi:hypothetical protein
MALQILAPPEREPDTFARHKRAGMGCSADRLGKRVLRNPRERRQEFVGICQRMKRDLLGFTKEFDVPDLGEGSETGGREH